jgi:hypothetical protein
MSDLFWLTDEQIERLRPFCPKSHGKPRSPRSHGHLLAVINEMGWLPPSQTASH